MLVRMAISSLHSSTWGLSRAASSRSVAEIGGASSAFRGLPCRQCCICSRSPPRSERPALPQHLPRWMSPSGAVGSQASAAHPVNSPNPDTISRSVLQTQKSGPASHSSCSALFIFLFKLPPSPFHLQPMAARRFLLFYHRESDTFQRTLSWGPKDRNSQSRNQPASKSKRREARISIQS